jgi:hypothetical protein
VSWRRLREALHPGALAGGMGTPFDLLDIFHSATVQLVFRLLRMLAILGFGVAIGAVAIALTDVEWNDPRTWPTPWEMVGEVADELDSIEDVMLVAFAGAGLYVLSFVACLKSFWIFPFAVAGYLVQLLWMVRAMSEEDEEPWLLAAVVPVVAWQVLGCAETYDFEELVLPIAFLGAFTLCWVAAFVVRGWMRRRDMSLWELIDTTRQRFDPAFYRWRPLPAAPPASEAAEASHPSVPPAAAPGIADHI